MKKIYDKLLLVLAILTLLAGVSFYLMNKDTAAKAGSVTVPPAADNPYQAVAIPEVPNQEHSWPEPEPQSSGPNWLYDVFTPPKIYIDSEGNFTAIPPPIDEPPKIFGIYLAGIEREPYRIQMQGFSGNRNKPEQAEIFLFDQERGLRFLIREGETNEESQIKVLDFTIKSEIDPEIGRVDIIALVSILDNRTGEKFELNDEEQLYKSEISLVFRSKEDPEVEVELEVDPETAVRPFETPLGKYILREINLEERTVTVEKLETEESDAEVRTLSLQNFEEKEDAESETAEPLPDEDEQALPSFFN